MALNQAYVETLGSASDLLSRTLQDQASLAEEVLWSMPWLFFIFAFWKMLCA